jgi:phosphoserine phosphatase
MPTKVILIRHGETVWNLERRYLGITDIGLNDTGVKQAQKVKDAVVLERVDKVYSSDRKRARDFAALVFGDIDVEALPALREIEFGAFEGLTYEEIMKYYPNVYTAWIKDPLSASIPCGESVRDVRHRVMNAIDRIVGQNAGKTVAIVTHAGPIAIVTQELSGAKDFWEAWPEPGCVRIVECK